MENIYPDVDPEELGDLYIRHIDRMTVEGLHSKSDIAAQLALRDKEIERLKAENEALRKAYWKMRNAAAGYSNYCEESANTRRCEREYDEAEAMFRAINAAMKENP